MIKAFIIILIASIIVMIAYMRSKNTRYITHIGKIEYINDSRKGPTIVVESFEKGSKVEKLVFKPGSELKLIINAGYCTLKFTEPEI